MTDSINNDLTSKLLETCGNDIDCTLIKTEPKCEEDFIDASKQNLVRRKKFLPDYFPDFSIFENFGFSKMKKDSEKRRKREMKDQERGRDKSKIKRKRERIEFKFKFLGRFYYLSLKIKLI